jgi:hypothetical protein
MDLGTCEVLVTHQSVANISSDLQMTTTLLTDLTDFVDSHRPPRRPDRRRHGARLATCLRWRVCAAWCLGGG